MRPRERLRFLPKPWDSDSLERLKGWHIILASSGMCEAGRIRRHLKRLLWKKECTVLLAGFQAQGTLGRLLAEGAKRVMIQGDEIRVAARIRQLDIYSGHADARALVRWAKARAPVRGGIFLTHGEPNAVQGLRARLQADGFDASQIRPAELDRPYEIAGIAVEEGPARPARIAAGDFGLDWHNRRAQFLLSLDESLRSAGGDAGRSSDRSADKASASVHPSNLT